MVTVAVAGDYIVVVVIMYVVTANVVLYRQVVGSPTSVLDRAFLRRRFCCRRRERKQEQEQEQEQQPEE